MPLPAKNNRINRPSIRDEVYTNLLDWIMEGVLRPGEKIVDKELASHMGVSRTPVREALRRLEDKHLVESSANRWTRVSEIPLKEPEMIYPIIWTLEGLAISTAVSTMTDQDFIKMDRANCELEKALKNADPVLASKADTEFHSVFIECSENFYLIKILQDLKIRFRRLEVNYFEGPAYAYSSIEEHKTIISALRSGDIELAEKTLRSNWKKSLERHRAIKRK
ncbi:GntR family transcriptional regulator [Desulfobacula sp.]